METKRDEEGKDWNWCICKPRDALGHQFRPDIISLRSLRGNQPAFSTCAQTSASRTVWHQFWSWGLPAVGYGCINPEQVLWEAQWDSGNKANVLLWPGDTTHFPSSLPYAPSLQLETAHHYCSKAAKHDCKPGAGCAAEKWISSLHPSWQASSSQCPRQLPKTQKSLLPAQFSKGTPQIPGGSRDHE